MTGDRVEHGPSEKAVSAAAAAYSFGVYPGDESEATEEEIKKMATEVLTAAHDPALALDRSVCLRDVAEWLANEGPRRPEHLMVRDLIRAFIESEGA